MPKPYKEYFIKGFVVLFLVVTAVICRKIAIYNDNMFGVFLAFLRSFIYIGLIFIWGMSLRKRIVHKHMTYSLTIIAGLMVGWFIARTLKFHLITDITAMRYLWYSYHIALILIPTVSLMTAISIGKADDYKTSKLQKLIFAVGCIGVLFVMSNDIHQLVFRFPEGKPMSDFDYSYGIVYFIEIFWDVIMIISTIFIILYKCRIPGRKKIRILPFVPISFALIYSALYILNRSFISSWLGDMTAVLCCIIISTWESCLLSGLIQTNTGYERMFKISSVPVQITDENYSLCYASDNINRYRLELLEKAVIQPVIINDQIRLSGTKTKGGYVFWEEDVSELMNIINELSGIKEELESYGEILYEENKKKEREKSIEEKRRLISTVQEKTEHQLHQISKIATEIRNADSEEYARKKLCEILVLGAYLKRRGNLIFLSQHAKYISSKELLLCLNESKSILKLLGVKCAYYLDFNDEIPVKAAEAMFEFYEITVESSINSLSALTASFNNNDEYAINLMINCEEDISSIAEKITGSSVEKQDGIWYCNLTFSGKGQ